MPQAVTGGCLCGAVRYRVEGEPINSRVCHCRLCQKAVGAPFNARILYRREDVALEGRYATAHSSPDLLRGFCPACGTSVFTQRPSAGTTSVTAGSLDDPGVFRPASHIWISSKQPWLVIADGLPQYEEMPPA